MIYVTGSKGFVGRRLVEKLKDDFTTIDKKDGSDILKIDFESYIQKYGYPSTIIHLAAETDPRESNSKIESYYRNNVLATKKILDTFSKSRIIYFSTSLVEYDTSNFYSLTKYLNELDAKQHSNAVGLRITTVYGDGGREEMIVPRIISKNVSYLTNYTRDFVWLDDLVDLIISLINSEKCGIINVASGDIHKINELAKKFGIVCDISNPKNEPSSNLLETDYLNSIGWKPTMTVEKYIQSKRFD